MHVAPSEPLGAALASFLAALVESVEALTVILAVGAVRGWTAAIAGASSALLGLAVLTVAFAPVLVHAPLRPLRLVVGAAVLLLGLRWLRKSVRRAAGLIPLRDEVAAYARHRTRLETTGQDTRPSLDRVAVATSFQAVALEGAEIIAIVLAMDAGGRLLTPAATGAGLAITAVILTGIAARRPIARIPENTLKLAAGVLLSSFGVFWIVQSLDGAIGADFLLPVLIVLATLAALASIRVARAP